MNWKRGLLRLWIVLTALWIGAVTFFIHPLQQIHDAKTAPLVLSYNDYQIEFPAETDLVTIKNAMAALIRQERAKQPDKQFDKSPEDEAEEIANQYHPVRIRTVIFRFAAISVGLPLFVLMVAFVIGWVLRGFRMKDSN